MAQRITGSGSIFVVGRTKEEAAMPKDNKQDDELYERLMTFLDNLNKTLGGFAERIEALEAKGSPKKKSLVPAGGLQLVDGRSVETLNGFASELGALNGQRLVREARQEAAQDILRGLRTN